eukprot:TRINITY_DN1564_c0_g1_i2.p1 TRINITY_DN1564_c0_g1~~TRINITY_DN1564_c0_g1_i2.p1  ORF type:complete len:105 (-),score=17.04 TRINITY_DN1564_c0_g1_i2:251-565(-)
MIDLLPPTLSQLTLGYSFNHDITHLLASLTCLKHLTVGDCFSQVLKQLPSTLESLSVGREFDHQLPPLPASLKTLVVSCHYPHELNLGKGVKVSKTRNALPPIK